MLRAPHFQREGKPRVAGLAQRKNGWREKGSRLTTGVPEDALLASENGVVLNAGVVDAERRYLDRYLPQRARAYVLAGVVEAARRVT